MKKFLLAFSLFFVITSLSAQLVITEIMFNPPESGSDSLEYIEIYNNSVMAIDMENYTMEQGVTFTFPAHTIAVGEYVVIAKDSVAYTNNFGGTAFQWTGGSTSNGGEDIVIADVAGMTIDSVDYDDNAAWPAGTDGEGASLVLCDIDGDHNDPANWESASTDAGFAINGRQVYANPGAASDCSGGSQFKLTRYSSTAGEADGSVMVIVKLENPSDIASPQTVTLTLSASSSATEGADFMFMDTTLSFVETGGPLYDTIMVAIIDDMDEETDETILLELLNPVNGTVGAATSDITITIEDNDEPPVTNYPAYDIGVVSAGDADGVTDSIGVVCQIQGTVHGINMRPSGLQFTIIDGNNDGIGLFYGSGNFGYTVNEGDEVIIQGTISQFNGLTQINPDTVWMVSAGNALFDATVVTAFDETTESQLMQLENVTLVDPADWQTSGSFNIDVTDGTNTFAMRVDSDVDISGTDAPTGAFNLTGIGGQFDSSSPYLSGYQILPRYMADIEAVIDYTDPDYPAYDIGVVTSGDADGVTDSLAVQCQIQGTVYGINMRPSGLQFTIIDDNNDGIGLFSGSNNFGYTVNEGDEVIIRGTISQFNGLTQINPDTVFMISAGNALFDATVVTAFDETTESQLMQLENVTLVDPADWQTSGSFNIDVTDGTNTFAMRVDSDVDISGTDAPTGAFNLTGIGGQFDNSSPYLSGYQILPRYMADIEAINDNTDPDYPAYAIGVVTSGDADGVTDSLGVQCQIQGTVYGINMRPSGLQFTIIDDNNDGIGLFSGSNNFGYTVNEGDEVIIRGTISQFNGLTQINPDTVFMISAGNALFDATVVTAFDETTESQLMQLENVTLVDPADWQTSGSFNIDVTDGSNTFTMRVDSDVDISGTDAPLGAFNLTGIGGQFDSSSPYLSGYQIFPRYMADIELISSGTAIRFISTSVDVSEDVGMVEIGIEYPAGDLVAWDATVSLDAGSSSATEGMDFTFVDTTFALSGFGTDTVYFSIPIIDDAVAEDMENIHLVLTSNNPGVDIAFDMFDVNIIDNEAAAYPAYPIGVVTAEGANGVPDSLDVVCQLQGVVYGVNLRQGGLQFVVIDGDNDGIGLFDFGNNFGYTVNEGDEIIVQGTISQFNGLTQISPDTVWMVSAGNALFDATVVTALDETTESQLIKLENLTIVDPNEWTNSGSGFNVTVTDGTNNYAMRIDNDVDLFGTAAPTQGFNLTGLGGQFDSSDPFTEGYQILPRYMADIDLIDAVNEPNLVKTNVYPNPVANTLMIRTEEMVDGIKLFNVFGQELMVKMQKSDRFELDMSNLPKGLYFVNLFLDGTVWTKSVVKE